MQRPENGTPVHAGPKAQNLSTVARPDKAFDSAPDVVDLQGELGQARPQVLQRGHKRAIGLTLQLKYPLTT